MNYPDLQSFKVRLGGEFAASVLTNYLKPQLATIYMKQPVSAFLLKNRIRKASDGNIEILEAFWGTEHNWPYLDLVHPILIYADLTASADVRNIETAGIIYEQELTRFIRED